MSATELRGGRVVVEADHFAVDLDALAARVSSKSKEARLPPDLAGHLDKLKSTKVSVAGASDVAVDKSGVSLKKILAVADSGRAKVSIPLVPQTVRIGPFALEIEVGAHVVLELVVAAGGVIERKETRGRLEPSLKLPLGVAVNGVYVDDAGNVVADLKGVPDLNLSLLALRGLRVPPTLNDLLALVFRDEAPRDPDENTDKDAQEAKESKNDGDAYIDFDGIEVLAKDVRVKAGALDIGAGVVIDAGEGTRLDIAWNKGVLRIDGRVDVKQAHLTQPSFALDGVRGSARIALVVDVKGDGGVDVSLDDVTAHVGAAHVEVGDSVVDVDAVGTKAPAQVRVKTGGGQPPRFSADFPGLAGTLRGGRIVVDVADRAVPIALRPGKVEGAVFVSEQRHKIDVVVDNVGVVVDDVAVRAPREKPLVTFAVSQAAARATGRLVAANDSGVAFSGAISVDAVLKDAIVEVGPVYAEGSGSAHVVVDDVAVVPGTGIELLRMKGDVELTLRAGRVPLFASSLEVLPGARAKVGITRVELSAEHKPIVEGNVDVDASAAAAVIDAALLTVPPSVCGLRVGRFVVRDGRFVAEGLRSFIHVT